MWVLTRIQTRIDDAFETRLAAIVESEAAGCPNCRGVLEATGALPTHCPACGRVRGVAWERQVEERANRELALQKQ